MARQPSGSPGSAISSGPVTFRAALASDTASIADNLHGRPGLTRRGLGSELLARSLRWVATVEPGWPMHLWVLAVNSAARRFYERHGGTLVEQAVKPMPDGSLPAVCRYISREPGRLVTPER